MRASQVSVLARAFCFGAYHLISRLPVTRFSPHPAAPASDLPEGEVNSVSIPESECHWARASPLTQFVPLVGCRHSSFSSLRTPSLRPLHESFVETERSRPRIDASELGNAFEIVA